MSSLHQLSGQYAELAEFDSEDDEAIRDTLEGLGGELDERLDAVARARANIVETLGAIDAEIERLTTRSASAHRRLDSIDEYVLRCLARARLKRRRTATYTFSVRSGRPSVLITDEAAIPTQLVRVKPAVPDKRAIGDHLKAGETVPGAELAIGPDRVTIR